jgi:CRP-like cAMP-binding protein
VELCAPPHGAKVEAKRTLFQNRILASLPADDLGLLQPHLEKVELPLRRVLEQRSRRIEAVYFLEDGLASVVASGGAQHSIEVGIIGREGMTGQGLLMGVDRTPLEIFVQSEGEAWRLGAPELTKALELSPGLHRCLLRHAHVFQLQTNFTALANGRYRLDERLARWLLMAQDRLGESTVDLTHEFLSLMLGVRRPGVTAALNAFEARGMIRGHRGGLTILDRPALEEAANGSYGVPEAEYQRLFAKD